MSVMKQLEAYKRVTQNLQQQNSGLLLEKQNIVHQLQSLFTVYNKQKETIEKLTHEKEDADCVCQTCKNVIKHFSMKMRY